MPCHCLLSLVGVEFQLSEVDYRQMEAPNAFMPIRVEKVSDVFLANPVELAVIPLTIDEALYAGVITEFEPLNDFSPNRAGNKALRFKCQCS